MLYVHQALVHLALEVGELAATLGILWRCLRGAGPVRLPAWRRLRPGLRWRSAAHIALAMASFPLVEMASARSIVRLTSHGSHRAAVVLVLSAVQGL